MNGFSFDCVFIDEYGEYEMGDTAREMTKDEMRADVLIMFIDRPYKFDNYKSMYVSKIMENLLELKLLTGHCVHRNPKGVLCGYVGISEAGKEWLNFREL